MRFVIQRVQKAEVNSGGALLGRIGKGFLVLIGVTDDDTEETADKMVRKMMNLRIFEDEQGKTNLDLEQVGGELLLISQFTLYADCKRGNRPSFVRAGKPDHAEQIYDYIVRLCRTMYEQRGERPDRVGTGQFGSAMQVSLVNDGPFTVLLDSDAL